MDTFASVFGAVLMVLGVTGVVVGVVGLVMWSLKRS